MEGWETFFDAFQLEITTERRLKRSRNKLIEGWETFFDAFQLEITTERPLEGRRKQALNFFESATVDLDFY